MPWRCPACAEHIRHNDAEVEPRPGALYRCHVCRLELTLDTSTNKLGVASLDGEDSVERKRIPETISFGSHDAPKNTPGSGSENSRNPRRIR